VLQYEKSRLKKLNRFDVDSFIEGWFQNETVRLALAFPPIHFGVVFTWLALG